MALGALGVLTRVTLQCEPQFWLHAREEAVPLAQVVDEIEELAKSTEHVEFFWFPHTRDVLLKRNTRVPPPRRPRRATARWVSEELLGNGAYGALSQLGRWFPRSVPAVNRFVTRCAAAEYVDASAAVFTSPRRVRFVEMEYAVPRAAVREAVRGVQRAVERYARDVVLPVEVRFSAADDIALSPAYGRDSAYIAVHVRPDQPHERYFGAVEELMVSLGGRPHWGKLHTRTAADLRTVYPRFEEFTALRDELDPHATFSNGYLDRVLGPYPTDRQR